MEFISLCGPVDDNRKSSVPSTIFCGFTDAFDSFREEEREQVSQPNNNRRSEERDRDDSSIALDECYDNSDESTVVSDSGASVLSIDYNGAEEVVKEGDKADLSDIDDQDDDSTVTSEVDPAQHELNDPEKVKEAEEQEQKAQDSAIQMKRTPSYRQVEKLESNDSSKLEEKLSNSGKVAQSMKLYGNPSAESKRKSMLKNLKNNIAKHGRYSVEVGATLRDLGRFHESCGQYDVSLTLFEEALDIFSTKYGDHDKSVVDMQICLARVQDRIGNDSMALKWYSKALFMIVDSADETDLDACNIRVAVSKIIQEKGFHKEAIKELKMALKGYRQTHGDEHVTVAETVDLIADYYTDSGNHGKANNVRGELVKLRVALHGNKSSEVADALKKWAMCHEDLDDLSNALKIMKQSYVMFHDVEGSDGINAEETLEQIGFLYSKMGRAEKAIKAHTSVALTRKNRYGEQSVELAASYLILGRAYLDDNNPERGLKALNRAMTCYGKANEANNDHIAELMETLHTIGELHLKTKDAKKAVKTFQKEKSVRTKYMEYDQLGIAATYASLGVAHSKCKQVDEAKEAFIEALQIYDRLDGRKTSFAETLYACGKAFQVGDDEDRAFLCFKEAAQIFMANGYNDDHLPMKETTMRLLELGLNDLTSLVPSLRCQLLDGESQKIEF